ncbi:fluoride efflux transporter FluC [Brachybacterium sp. AOP25-B2-12]|uniref:fluoride efflux transporter FluC n=1 Tax=Brachybacterium sp. AOP25-B2-12 TaxID=3457710 RepID=UPI0040341382
MTTASARPPRPLHLRPGAIGLVVAGGVIGTALREALTLTVPPAAGIPWALLACNLSGAFVLGMLLEALARRGPDAGLRRALRLFVGTGVIGGYTSYSALSLAVTAAAGAGHPGIALVYGVGSVILGLVATGAGILVAGLVPRADGDAA